MALLESAEPVLAAAAAPAMAGERRKVGDIRIPELDGFRGLMTLFVVFSHFFVEVPHGIGVFYLGWVAVIGFFVLSGYLVGRLILEKKDAGNFLPVFYLRRVCRTFPTYFLASAALLLIAGALAGEAWTGGPPPLPGWSYFVFAQNFFMLSRGSVGLHWLAPTWTLALEEQFYIFAPFLFLLLPRRWWVAALTALCLSGVALRAAGTFTGWLGLAPLALLPTSADVLCIGMLLAVLVKENRIDWQRWSTLLRVAPIGFLFLAAAAQHLDGGEVGPWFQVLDPPLVALASAFFLLMLVKGAPEARRFQSPVLRFFGDISYSVYLTHLVVLSLMHGFILGGEPDMATPAQLLVTIAALPVTTLVGWAMTRLLEQPITAWGRSFRWQ
jgi:peptidoglycan/LPS O-acetylase OafA/YrhL